MILKDGTLVDWFKNTILPALPAGVVSYAIQLHLHTKKCECKSCMGWIEVQTETIRTYDTGWRDELGTSIEYEELKKEIRHPSDPPGIRLEFEYDLDYRTFERDASIDLLGCSVEVYAAARRQYCAQWSVALPAGLIKLPTHTAFRSISRDPLRDIPFCQWIHSLLRDAHDKIPRGLNAFDYYPKNIDRLDDPLAHHPA